jgi:hypothetical protein
MIVTFSSATQQIMLFHTRGAIHRFVDDVHLQQRNDPRSNSYQQAKFNNFPKDNATWFATIIRVAWRGGTEYPPGGDHDAALTAGRRAD